MRRAFRRVLAGVDGAIPRDPQERPPREPRHGLVSPLADSEIPLEGSFRLVGHSGTATTEEVYRERTRPVTETGAVVREHLHDRRGSTVTQIVTQTRQGRCPVPGTPALTCAYSVGTAGFEPTTP